MGKLENGISTIWKILTIIAIAITILCFFTGVVLMIVDKFVLSAGFNVKTVFGIDPNVVSMIFALFGLNLAVVFFMPMLITENQVIKTVRSIVDKSVDQKFIKEKMERYATQTNIADILRKVSTLLFQQGRYIWSLSCALNALNEYMKITPDGLKSQIHNMWISIEAMINIIASENDDHLLESEFPVSNKEIELMKNNPEKRIRSKEEQLKRDKEDMLIRLYIELFNLIYQKEDLIHIIGCKFKKQVNHCLDVPVRRIIDMTAEVCDIKSGKIRSEIRKYSEWFENVKTRKTAEKTLKKLIKN
jgi:hypothetical protein